MEYQVLHLAQKVNHCRSYYLTAENKKTQNHARVCLCTCLATVYDVT